MKTESSGNEFAIGVVGGRLVRQPRNVDEAIATAMALEAQGFNFSVGCRQINKTNFQKYGLTIRTAFDPQANSKAGVGIYRECLDRAIHTFGKGDVAARAALSCYYSGNFTVGQRKEGKNPSYVEKVLANAGPEKRGDAMPIPVVSTQPPGGKNATTKPGASAAPAPKQVPKEPDAESVDWDVFKDF